MNYKVVVSSENSVYMAWQTQVFCNSVMTRLGQSPTVIVHDSGMPLLPEFELLNKMGCQIIEAPSFKQHPVQLYPPRNELGSLMVAASSSEIAASDILFCEPDMIWRRKPPIGEGLSGEYYDYLNYEEPRVQLVSARYGLKLSPQELTQRFQVGVPYFVPKEILPTIAPRWLEVLDAFKEIGWIDIMYAFGLALAIDNINIRQTKLMDANYHQFNEAKRDLIHYCYGDDTWNKRHYFSKSPVTSPSPDLPQAPQGTILHEIITQITETRNNFYLSS